jgi:hypothetical protein
MYATPNLRESRLFPLWLFALACLLAVPTGAGDRKARVALEDDRACDDEGGDDRYERHCEVRELTLPAGRLAIDAAPNGGIEVHGEKRGDIRIQAKVVAQGRTEEEARALAGQIRIETDSVVRAVGPQPRSRRDQSFWVSYKVAVPEEADLRLETMNGGIALYDVKGKADFKTVNGGVTVDSASGSVQGRTTNGGVDISLRGTAWEGDGLDVETTNGGVKVTIPSDYNARLVTGTVNGGMRVDFPVTVQGRIDRRLDVEIGRGGPTVRAVTTNGGVVIRRR